MLICGQENMGQKHLGASILDKLVREKLYVQSLDLPFLLSDSAKVRYEEFISIVGRGESRSSFPRD
jgi:hypothetical protein